MPVLVLLRLRRMLHCEESRNLLYAISSCTYSFSNGSFNAFHPVLDGKVISERPTPSILTGNIHRVALMVGYGISVF